jgi:hypothetical protein
MKKSYFAGIGIIALLLVPFFASAQVVSSSLSTQQSFLAELQALQQELSALAATVSAMIAAAGGTASSAAPSIASLAGPSLSSLITTPTIPSALSKFSNSGDLSSALLSALAPPPTSVLTTPGEVSTSMSITIATTVASTGSTSTSGIQSAAMQLDPSCISGLFGNGAKCGGLYYCGTGTDTYWSSAQCIAQ